MAAAVTSLPKPSSPPQPQAASSPAEEPSWRRGPVPPHVKAAAGSLGGVVEVCCLQPTDVVKTRLQLDRAGAAYRGKAHCGATVAPPRSGRGSLPSPAHSQGSASNASLQSRLRDPATGALSAAALLEVVKIRLQQQREGGSGHGQSPPRYRGAVHCAATVVCEEGLHGLWAGAAPTVLRNGTNQVAMFACKSKLDAALWGKRDGDGKELHFTRSMASGFLATAVGPVLTWPFNVVKSRLMAQGGGGGVRYRGMAHALRTIYTEEGIRALWKGLLPRLVRIPTGGALAWAVTDQCRISGRRRISDPLVSPWKWSV
uniref:Uncharacterized protein n=1 Tax=Setaria viridis TaxID=4556 RepID=A0A4U6TGS5_SETVI|nr:hypothetical protein SEVIR_8G064800v2 [Setaria viridis]